MKVEWTKPNTMLATPDRSLGRNGKEYHLLPSTPNINYSNPFKKTTNSTNSSLSTKIHRAQWIVVRIYLNCGPLDLLIQSTTTTSAGYKSYQEDCSSPKQLPNNTEYLMTSWPPSLLSGTSRWLMECWRKACWVMPRI